MACIDRIPRCGTVTAGVETEPWSEISTIAGTIGGVISAIATVTGVLEKVEVAGGVLSIGSVTIGSGAIAGGLAAGAAAIGTILVVLLYVRNRCNSEGGVQECVAGVVNEVIESFSEWWEHVFPFAAMHDRVDVVVKARFWDIVESGQAHVHCTNEMTPRRSEIMRCYYYDPQVCNAGNAAYAGANVGGAIGAVVGTIAAAAIGCATVILCILALLVAAIIAVALALGGALAGGQIGRATSEETSPTAAEGETLQVGDYVTIVGNMQRREFDDSANVFWWASDTTLHGRASEDLPRQPFSYCEVDDEFTADGCPLPGPY